MGYTLIISEKPSAAERIAKSLAGGKVEKISKGTASYYKIERKGKKIVVAPAVGHLFVLAQKGDGGWHYPVYETEWEPVFVANAKNTWSKKYYDNIQSLVKGASHFISATDYDVEGSVIAFNILRFMCGVKDAKRMKFSTLTKPDLEEAYDNASEHLDFGQIEAGLTRHTLDFLWGINLSRALTLALKTTGGYKTLSTGRVQGPTLKMLEDREKEIKKFVPVPFWHIQLTGIANKDEILFLHVTDKFWKKPEAEKAYNNSKGQKAIVEDIKKSNHKQAVPFPFDLTSLQRESYSNFGYSPKQTLDIAQSLYEKALISYPRTSSQKLSAKLGLKKIIGNLAGQKQYFEMCSKILEKKPLKPNEGKKSDPAHPAIFPTGKKPKEISSYQRRVYDMIVRRFLAVFAEHAVRESVRVTLDAGGEKYSATGTRTVELGWLEYYGPYSRLKDEEMPKLTKGQELKVKDLELLKKETQPPSRFSQASLLKEMEINHLGTKATRAGILETLYNRGYIKEKSIVVSELGRMVADVLHKYAPEIVSVELTHEFEKDMVEISEGKDTRKHIVERAEKHLDKILKDFKKKEIEIGKELLEGVKKVMKEETTIGKCKCGGNLVIKYSRAHKRFVACDTYPKCTETFSLPHQGQLTILSETCKTCGLFVVSVKRFGKRPWKLCVRCGFVNKRKVPAKDGAKGAATKKVPSKKKATAKKKAPKKATKKKASGS